MAFSKRTCITGFFHLHKKKKEREGCEEIYFPAPPPCFLPKVRPVWGFFWFLWCFLLPPSSLFEIFEVLENRLEKLYEGTKSAYAQEGFDLFWDFVEDEIDEDGFTECDDEETEEKKQAIHAELKIVRHILEMARAIKTNAKIIALKEVLQSAFDHQTSEGLDQKAVVLLSLNERRNILPQSSENPVIAKRTFCSLMAILTML